MEYEILTADGERELGKLVNERLANGWDLVGGIAVAQRLCDRGEYFDDRCTLYDAGFVFAQAMVKR